MYVFSPPSITTVLPHEIKLSPIISFHWQISKTTQMQPTKFVPHCKVFGILSTVLYSLCADPPNINTKHTTVTNVSMVSNINLATSFDLIEGCHNDAFDDSPIVAGPGGRFGMFVIYWTSPKLAWKYRQQMK